MRRLALVLLLALLLSAFDLASADEGIFTNAEYRFRITHPGAPWQVSEPAPPSGATYALKIARPEGDDEVSVVIYVVVGSGFTNSDAARQSSQQLWQSTPGITDIIRGDATLAGLDALWLRARYDVGGVVRTLRQHFVVFDDKVYILQSLAPIDVFDDAEFAPMLESFALLDVDQSTVGLRPIADRCGSEIDWTSSWQEASDRARREQKTVLTVFEVYRGVVGSRYSPALTFMNQDLIELINERFVAMWWETDSGAPFNDPAVFGLGGSTLGQGMLFATADGRVVGQTVSFNAFHVYDVARDVLHRHPGAPPTDPSDVAELLRRGDLAAADARLQTPSTAEEWLQQADLWRLRRNGEKAIAALNRASRRGADVTVDEGVIHLRLGEYADCAALLEDRDELEAVFWHAVTSAVLADDDDAMVELEPLYPLCEEYPESRWAWRAAALLLGRGVASGWDRPAWPSEAQMRALDQPGYEGTDDIKVARDEAIAFLVESQHESGVWLSPMSMSRPENKPAPPTIAITAICGEGLLPYRAADRAVKDAADAALEVVLEADLQSNPELLFDNTIWAQIFGLRFLARCVEARVGDRRRIVRAMNDIVDALDNDEHANGGWAYFQPSGGSHNNPIGFVTAAGLCALIEARDAGATVSDEMIERTGDVIVSLIDPRGQFGYMPSTGMRDIDSRQAEASLRGPLYALSLIREDTGRGGRDILVTALDVYMKHRTHTIAERGKALCHTGPEGTASYYLMYGYSFSAEALAELPERERARYRVAILADVLALRQTDGSFCGNPMIGRQYGAAMALHVFSELAPAH